MKKTIIVPIKKIKLSAMFYSHQGKQRPVCLCLYSIVGVLDLKLFQNKSMSC